MKHVREVQISPGRTTPSSDSSSPRIDHSNHTILSALKELSFSSVRPLSRATHLPVTTGHSRFSEKFGCTARHLRSVPYILSEDKKGGTRPIFKVFSDDTAGT
jgi:hypothetical protein